jgi:hypothetical protein
VIVELYVPCHAVLCTAVRCTTKQRAFLDATQHAAQLYWIHSMSNMTHTFHECAVRQAYQERDKSGAYKLIERRKLEPKIKEFIRDSVRRLHAAQQTLRTLQTPP